MKLDRFINRPVLSTVISIIIVILGVIGLVTLPIEQYPDIAPPTVSVRASYTGAKRTDNSKQCCRAFGRSYKRCGKHGLHVFVGFKYR